MFIQQELTKYSKFRLLRIFYKMFKRTIILIWFCFLLFYVLLLLFYCFHFIFKEGFIMLLQNTFKLLCRPEWPCTHKVLLNFLVQELMVCTTKPDWVLLFLTKLLAKRIDFLLVENGYCYYLSQINQMILILLTLNILRLTNSCCYSKCFACQCIICPDKHKF